MHGDHIGRCDASIICIISVLGKTSSCLKLYDLKVHSTLQVWRRNDVHVISRLAGLCDVRYDIL